MHSVKSTFLDSVGKALRFRGVSINLTPQLDQGRKAKATDRGPKSNEEKTRGLTHGICLYDCVSHLIVAAMGANWGEESRNPTRENKNTRAVPASK